MKARLLEEKREYILRFTKFHIDKVTLVAMKLRTASTRLSHSYTNEIELIKYNVVTVNLNLDIHYQYHTFISTKTGFFQ